MEFSTMELTAIMSAAKVMMQADGRATNDEAKCIAAEFLRFGVQRNKFAEILLLSEKMTSTTMFSILLLMTNSEKKYVLGFLAAIMVSDGHVDDAEIKMWNLLCALIDSPAMNLNDALDFWKNN